MSGGFLDVRRSRIETARAVRTWGDKYTTESARLKEIKEECHRLEQEITQRLSRTQTLEVARLVTDWGGQGPIDLPGCEAARRGARVVFTARA